MNVCAKTTLWLRRHTKMNIRTERYEESYVNYRNTTAFVSSRTHCPKGNPHTALLPPCCMRSITAWGSSFTFLLFTERRGRSAHYTTSFPQFLLGKLARNRLDGWSASWVGNWLPEHLESSDQCFLGWQLVTCGIDPPVIGTRPHTTLNILLANSHSVALAVLCWVVLNELLIHFCKHYLEFSCWRTKIYICRYAVLSNIYFPILNMKYLTNL